LRANTHKAGFRNYFGTPPRRPLAVRIPSIGESVDPTNIDQ